MPCATLQVLPPVVAGERPREDTSGSTALGVRDASRPRSGAGPSRPSALLRERYLAREMARSSETPEEMCWRVARAIAEAEERFGRSPAGQREVAAAFYDMMVDGYFLPNSPTLHERRQGQSAPVLRLLRAARGRLDGGDLRLRQVRARSSISRAEAPGFAFSRLRPKNDLVRSTGRPGLGSGVASCACSTRPRKRCKPGRHASRRQHGRCSASITRTSSSSSSASSTAASRTSISRSPSPTRSWTRSRRAATTTSVNPRTGQRDGPTRRPGGVRPHRPRGVAHRRSRA